MYGHILRASCVDDILENAVILVSGYLLTCSYYME